MLAMSVLHGACFAMLALVDIVYSPGWGARCDSSDSKVNVAGQQSAFGQHCAQEKGQTENCIV